MRSRLNNHYMSDRLTEQQFAEILARRAPRRVSPTPQTPVTFAVPGVPVAKPRQTTSDKWKQRPAVVRYRNWADRARQCMLIVTGSVSQTIGRLEVVAYFPLPARLSEKDRAGLKGSQHMVKPDADNVLKSVSDSLCRNDQMIHTMSIRKRWDDDGNGPRVEITLY
jgi:Holliday junction resolvase RusA-like endonuclease